MSYCDARFTVGAVRVGVATGRTGRLTLLSALSVAISSSSPSVSVWHETYILRSDPLHER